MFVIVFLVTSFSLSRIRKISSKLGHYDTPNDRSSHNDFVPTLGGIAFFVSLIVFFFFSNFYNINDTSLSILLAITIMFFVGLTDDLKDLSPKVKFIGQLLALSVLIIQSDYRILSFHGFLGIYELNMFFSVFLSMFLILAFINAFNLIDGIDGMSSVTGIVISACFGFLFYKLQLFFFMFISVAVISMLLAFLRYNFSSRKKIFMGDTGSLAIGGALGVIAVITKHELVLSIVGGLFVLETASVIVQVISFKLTGKRIFAMAPLHHHFEKRGWAEPTIVIRFWIIAIILAIVGLATLKLR